AGDESGSGESDPAENPFLVIGETDLTDPFAKCLDQSGYVDPGPDPGIDPDEEIRLKQLSLEATLRWLSCARSNGYPELEDPPPLVADDWATQPMARLPLDMTADQLTALLEACPNFDAALFDAREEAWAALGPDPTTDEIARLDAEYPIDQPLIGFDAPGLDGRYDGTEPDPAVAEKLAPLLAILNQAANTYWAEKNAATGIAGVG
ncbi:MAG: hypothetical protein LBD70_06850, partial [Bifidobacteriaceae bacterium]|nr:hypothetical protein [Bifidobacteriaceae bacterium]